VRSIFFAALNAWKEKRAGGGRKKFPMQNACKNNGLDTGRNQV
jgi:hypothetical protein